MDADSLAPWLITLLLILFADYIAVTETSLAAVSRVRMKTLADRGDRKAEKVLYVLDHFDLAVSTILICTNIAHLAAASLVTVAVTRKWGLSAVTVSTLLTSLVVFFAAEMLPKSIAKKYADRLALVCVGPLLILMKLFSPLSKVLSAIGNAAAHFIKADPEPSVTEDEIYDIIEDMTEEGSLDEAHGDLISSALQFENVTVDAILTPRVDVVAIDIDSSQEEILQLIKEHNYSRLPVFEGSKDNIIGILRIRKYIRAYLKNRDVNIREIMDKPLFIADSVGIDEVLPMMSKERQNMAIVSDHHGGTVGIVTVEDILEELVGEIWDEDDDVKGDPVQDLGDGSYLVDAEESVGDVFDKIGFEDAQEDEEEILNTRVGEWVFEQLHSIPKEKDSFTYEGLTVTVSKMEHNRIRKVRITLPEKEEGGEEA